MAPDVAAIRVDLREVSVGRARTGNHPRALLDEFLQEREQRGEPRLRRSLFLG